MANEGVNIKKILKMKSKSQLIELCFKAHLAVNYYEQIFKKLQKEGKLESPVSDPSPEIKNEMGKEEKSQ